MDNIQNQNSDTILTIQNIRDQDKNSRISFVEYILLRSVEEVIAEIKSDYNFIEEPSSYIIQKNLYPVDENKRPLNLREWLVCENEKIYCVYCVCMSETYPEQQKSLIEGLHVKPSLSSMNKILQGHECSTLHKTNRHKYLKSGREINSSFNYNESTIQARKTVKIILKIIVFLATHGLAFRANSHESVQNLQFDFDANKNYFKVENEGHFLGMVKLLAEENPELKAHLKQYKEDQANSERYKTTFMSDKFVKKALSVIREYLTKRIVEELKRNGTMYGIQMDTSQDVSVKEQCSIVIRYINDNLMVSERTIFFLESPCTTGESLYNLLKTSLDKIGLSTKDIAGFSFDGAQNMRSADAGVNHYIKKDNPRSLYTWCISHRLNIIVKNAFKSGLAKYILALVESTASFINSSYKRMNIWMEVVQGLKNVNSKIKLKIIGGVRWTSKHEAIHVVTKTEENFLAIIKTYLKICNLDSLENNALTKACNILNSWLDYENVLAAVIFDKIFCVLLPVTKDLQRTGLCLFEAIRLIKKLFTDINDIKNNYGKLLNDAKCFINKLNNLFSHDQYINSLDLGPDFFHIHVEDIKFDNVFIDNVIEPVIDNLLLGLEESFLDDFQDMMLYREISLLDLNFYKKCLEENNEISLKRLCVLNNITDSESVVQELYNFLKEYEEYEKDLHEVSMLNSGKKVQLQTHTKNDLIEQGTDSEEDEEPDEHEFNPLYIDSESDLDEDILNIEKTIVVKRKCYCVQCILRYFAIFDISAKKYANLYTLYKYVALLPCTETRCERDFSYLKMIKNCRRSLLIEKNLQSLMTICLESDLFKDIDLEDVVDEIAYTSTKLAKKLL